MFWFFFVPMKFPKFHNVLHIISYYLVTIQFPCITYSKGRRGREVFSIYPFRHPSMDGIIQGRKPWQKLKLPTLFCVCVAV
jgi:hypothetical protein